MPDARYRDLMPGWAPKYLPPEVLFWRLCRSGLCLALVAGMAPGACPLRDACRDGAVSGFSYGYSLPVGGTFAGISGCYPAVFAGQAAGVFRNSRL